MERCVYQYRWRDCRLCRVVEWEQLSALNQGGANRPTSEIFTLDYSGGILYAGGEFGLKRYIESSNSWEHIATPRVLNSLYDAGVSADDVEEVLASDFIFSGKLRRGGAVNLIIELSHFAELTDITRAQTRGQIVSDAGIRAYPVVTAKVWSADMIDKAQARDVIVVHGKRVNKDSWEQVVDSA